MRASTLWVALGGVLLSGCEPVGTGTWFRIDDAGIASGYSRHSTLVSAGVFDNDQPGEPTGLFLIGGTTDCPGNEASNEVHRWLWDDPALDTGTWVPDVDWPLSSVVPPLYGVAAAFDPIRDQLLLFGGYGLVGDCIVVTNPTEGFGIRDQNGWNLLAGSSTRPPARGGAVMWWDEEAEQVMLFGGTGLKAEGGTQVLTDLWAWDGDDWNEISLDPKCDSPPEALDFAAAYDPYRMELILVGNTNDSDGRTVTGTWGYSGNCWNHYQAAGTPPPPRAAASMVADPARGRLVLTGGAEFGVGEPLLLPGTWEWDGWQWHEIASSDAPDVWGAALGTEPSRGTVLLFGGVRDGDRTVPVTRTYEGPPVPSRYTQQGCTSAGGELGLSLLLVALFLFFPRRRGVALLALLVCAPATLQAEEPEQVAYLGMVRTNGVDPKDADTVSGLLQTWLGQNGRFKVIGPSDIQAMLGLEGQKQILGCETDSSCLADLGGALGAEHAVYADLNLLGSTAVFNLTLMNVGRTEVVNRISRTVKTEGTLEPVLDLLEEAVAALYGPLKEVETTAETPPPATVPSDPAVAEAPPPQVGGHPVGPPGPDTPPASAEKGSTLRGFYAQARADADFLGETGLAGGLTLGWGRTFVGPQLTLLVATPLILRLEARLTPMALGPVHPYASVGVAFSNPALGPRGALGVEGRFGHLLVFLEFAGEAYLLRYMQRLEHFALLVAGGVGWRF